MILEASRYGRDQAVAVLEAYAADAPEPYRGMATKEIAILRAKQS